MKIGELEFSIQDIKDLLKEGSSLPFINSFKNKTPKDKIGIVVGITTEEDDEKNRVDNDIVRAINNFLNDNNIVEVFRIKELDNEEAKNIDNHNWIKTLEKYDAHLIIYGHVAKRNGGAGYSLKLEAGVRHKPIPGIVSQVLSQEFGSLFPRQRFIPINNDLLGFEVTAKEIAIVVQYMIGVSFLLSGFLGDSFQVLKTLDEKIDRLNSQEVKIKDTIKEKTQKRILDVCVAQCSLLYDLYSINRDIELIKMTKQFIDIIHRLNPNEIRIKHLEAMYYFLIENNVDYAIKLLKTFDDALKPYNLAFLYFFKGEIESGLRYYRRAFKREIPQKVFLDLEQFVTEALEKFPEKYQFIFSQGLINYKGKKDYKLAVEDFKDFIQKAYFDEKYQELIKLSVDYKNDASKKMQIKGGE